MVGCYGSPHYSVGAMKLPHTNQIYRVWKWTVNNYVFSSALNIYCNRVRQQRELLGLWKKGCHVMFKLQTSNFKLWGTTHQDKFQTFKFVFAVTNHKLSLLGSLLIGCFNLIHKISWATLIRRGGKLI